jgi:carbon storage regulator
MRGIPANTTRAARARGGGSAMLVITRGKSQQIVIDDTIVVTVVDIRGEKIRLGVEAPREVPVHRREVRDRICGEAPPADSAVSAEGSGGSEGADP